VRAGYDQTVLTRATGYPENDYLGAGLASLLVVGKRTVRSEALGRAATALGDEGRLADALRMPVCQVQRWIVGADYPPVEIYQKTLDLLIAVGTH
jgi:hypothetical protein